MNATLSFSFAKITVIAAATALATEALAQTPTPPPGYFDIPAGFDFPADKQTLEAYRKAGRSRCAAQARLERVRGHDPTNAGQQIRDLRDLVFGRRSLRHRPSPQALGPRRVVRHSACRSNSSALPGQAGPQAAGDALLSEVMFNFANYNHIRTKKLFSQAELDRLQQSGDKDPEIANNTTIPAFPAESISLKTVWWPVAKDKPTPMPIFDPETETTVPPAPTATRPGSASSSSIPRAPISRRTKP